MPSQHVETLETIHALKRALRREKEAATDQPISSATNRGNKLKKGASYVHAGALPYPHGPDGYKQQIEHAGYTRYVLDKNPRRYNEYGDELADSESDPEADADAEDENPYSNVHLEELLRPLTHPAELATHPTLSIPFLDAALPDMIQTTEEKLRQERASLWRAKHLHRQLLGDESWMPSDAVETTDDWDLFQPRPITREKPSKKRKRDEDPAPIPNGDTDQDHAEISYGTQTNGGDGERERVAAMQKSGVSNAIATTTTHTKSQSTGERNASSTEDADVQDAELTVNGIHDKSNSQSEIARLHSAAGPNGQNTQAPSDGETTTAPHEPNPTTTTTSSPRSTPPPSRRMTRALAAETNPSRTSTPQPPSPTISTISPSLLTPDPLFLLPHNTHRPFHSLALPKDERDETRRLLTMYIQKQEETIRSTENVLGKLIKALRMRDQVLEWCKAEGHVGEWSDGEDWIDAEHWGEREEDLKKGKDEDEAGAAGAGGAGDEDGGHGVGIQGAGGKKKRRRRAAGGERE